MSIVRRADGVWAEGEKNKNWHPLYQEFLLKCLNSFDLAFRKAKDKSEFEFVMVLLRVKTMQTAGWDPWESTAKLVRPMLKLERSIKNNELSKNLSLWIYGHIVEASEPYEIIANMLEICGDGRWNVSPFPDRTDRHGNHIPQTPAEKIIKVKEIARRVNLQTVAEPFDEIYIRDLRNSIFHSDYALYGNELRLPRGGKKIYTHDESQAIVNKSLAYFEALTELMNLYKRSYSEPKIINAHLDFSRGETHKIMIIVREGEGLTGLRSAWTKEELAQGKIAVRMGSFTRQENKMLDGDPFLGILPPIKRKQFNRFLERLPYFIRKYLVRLATKYNWFN